MREHDFRIGIDSSVDPELPFFFEFDLFLVDGDTIRFFDEVLVVVLGV